MWAPITHPRRNINGGLTNLDASLANFSWYVLWELTPALHKGWRHMSAKVPIFTGNVSSTVFHKCSSRLTTAKPPKLSITEHLCLVSGVFSAQRVTKFIIMTMALCHYMTLLSCPIATEEMVTEVYCVASSFEKDVHFNFKLFSKCKNSTDIVCAFL